MAIQPAMFINRAVIMSIGGICNGERWENVFPVCTDDLTIGDDQLCLNAVNSMVAGSNPLDLFQGAVSSDLSISFVQAEGALPGKIPARVDYTIGARKGHRPAGALPLNVAGVLSFYADPAQLGVGGRMRVAKSMIPGIYEGDVTGQLVPGAQLTRMANWGLALAQGFLVDSIPAKRWYRILNKLDHGAGAAWNVFSFLSRGYLGTVRRRLLPH